MLKISKNKFLAVFFACCILLSILVLYIANKKMPFKMDDEWYITNLVTGAPVSSFYDVWESQICISINGVVEVLHMDCYS